MTVTQTWDSRQYQQNGAFVHQLAGEVLGWLDAKPGDRILDIGCGDGHLTSRIMATGASVVGLDSSTQMAAAAQALGIDVTVGSAESIPFDASSFDAVFSNAALHWVRDHDAMLGGIKRVLKPGGRFVAECGGHGNIAAITVAMRSALEKFGFKSSLEDVNYYPAPKVYTRRLERHGFTVERMALIPRPTPLAAGGMEGWIRTFRRGVLEALPVEVRDSVVNEAVRLLTPALRDEEGNWTADYVRLRFIARA
jgi:trans-aconitate methyltransferase